MSANMQAPPPQQPPPSNAPPSAAGHGAFSEEEIQQIMAETGFTYQQVCQAIDQTGATTKEQVFPQFYSGQGIQPDPSSMPPPPTEGQPVGPGVVQGEPAQVPIDPAAAAEPGAAAMPTQPADGIDPAVAEHMHKLLASKTRR